MNIDPETGKNYGLPPTAEDVRNFAAELDDRDEATQEELDMLRHIAERLEVLEKERDEARRSVCEMSIQLGGVYRRVGGKTVEVTTPEGCAEIMRWDCFKDNPTGNA